MSDPARYAKSAYDLKKKLETGEAKAQRFRRLSRADVEKVVRQAGDPETIKAQDRKDLEDALLKIGVRAYTNLKPHGKGHYLLFHHGTAMAKLVDVINGGKENDKELKQAVKKLEGWAR